MVEKSVKQKVLGNMLSTEQELFTQLENRERIVKQLKELDIKIAKNKGLIIHKMEANELKKSNYFEMVEVNVEKSIPINIINDVLKDFSLLGRVFVRVDYQNTQQSMENIGIRGFVADRIIGRIKLLQKDVYKELKIKD